MLAIAFATSSLAACSGGGAPTTVLTAEQILSIGVDDGFLYYSAVDLIASKTMIARRGK